MTRSLAERFLILGAARTGSTMLRRMLNSHPAICCHGEIFAIEIWGLQGYVDGEDRIDLNDPRYRRAKRLRDEEPARFLREIVWPAGPPPVGAKILYKDLEDPKWAGAYEAIRADAGVRIVHLTRENRLKRLISQTAMDSGQRYIAYKTHSVRLVDGRPVEEPAGPAAAARFRLDPQACLSDFEAVEAAENRIRQAFARHERFEASYEKIVDAASGQLEDLQRFLGVEPRALESGTLKVHSNHASDHIENYDELRAYFRGSRFEKYFR